MRKRYFSIFAATLVVLLTIGSQRSLPAQAPGKAAPTAHPPRVSREAEAVQRRNPAAQEDHPTIQREAALAEAVAKRKILDSPEWHEVLRSMQDWLGVEKLYGPEEVARIKREFNAKVIRMSSRELADFMADIEERLKVLLSPEARAARVWLAQYMALHAKTSPAEFAALRPNVLHMTADELAEQLQAVEARRQQVRQAQAAFECARQQQLGMVQFTLRRQRQDEQRALDRAYENLNVSPNLGSPYAPLRTPVSGFFPNDVGNLPSYFY